MGLFNFASILFFVFTTLLFFLNRRLGKTYVYFGIPTLLFVFTYGYLPVINSKMSNIPMFVVFSLMIILFSIILGLITYLLFKKNKISIIVSVIMSIIIIFTLFNFRGILSYLFIPILLVKLQEFINTKVILSENKKIKKI